MKKAVKQVLTFIRKGNVKTIPLILRAAKEFFDVVFYALMFPKVREEYNLRFKENVRAKNQ